MLIADKVVCILNWSVGAIEQEQPVRLFLWKLYNVYFFLKKLSLNHMVITFFRVEIFIAKISLVIRILVTQQERNNKQFDSEHLNFEFSDFWDGPCCILRLHTMIFTPNY